MEYLCRTIKETEEMKIEIDYNGAFAVAQHRTDEGESGGIRY